MKTGFDTALLESGDIMRRGLHSIVNNVGRVVALITLFISALVIFTDVSFAEIRSESFTTVLIVMLIASYLMYFSLEDAGEKLGRESEEYKSSDERYLKLRDKIGGDDLSSLRDFLSEYTREELEYRRTIALIRCGGTKEELVRFAEGEKFDRRTERSFRRIMKMKPQEISPRTLLSKRHRGREREICDPEGRKLLRMLIKLLPTTLCTVFTVSLVLTVKEDMTASAVLGGLFKLCALPIIGFRGYQDGYVYAKEELVFWTETKTRLLDAFLKSESAKP